MLTGGDRNSRGLRNLGEPWNVVGKYGFLEPGHVVVFEDFRHLYRLLCVIAVVGIDKYLHVVADCFSDGLETLDILTLRLAEVFADLHLHPRNPPFDIADLLGDKFVLRVVRPATGAVDGNTLVRWPQQPVNRLVEHLALEIPQRNIYGRNSLKSNPLAAKPTHPPVHVLPQLFNHERVLPHQHAAEVLVNHLAYRPLARRHAESDCPLVGVNVNK